MVAVTSVAQKTLTKCEMVFLIKIYPNCFGQISFLLSSSFML